MFPGASCGVPLTVLAALDLAREVLAVRDRESTRLTLIHSYLRDEPKERRLGGLPAGLSEDVQRLQRMSRVNLLRYVVAARVQGLYVDGFRTPASPDNLASWDFWQRNRFDARQIGVHRAGLSFGASYVTVLPGRVRGGDMPVIRGASPRKLTVAYGMDDDWPEAALQQITEKRWRLIDSTHVYELTRGDGDTFELDPTDIREHGATYDGEAVCPVVRFRDTDDLDDPVRGIVEPFIPLQDQINITTFGLQVAQHYGAFRQRYILGWLADNEQQALETGASRLMMFEDSPQDVKIGEFGQTDLRGYIESREASIRHMATVSQTPVHELLGELVNLSAEALEAARASHQAAVQENKLVMGEAHEQVLNLAAETTGGTVDPSASIMWGDTRIRSLSEAAIAFGALVEKLGVPPRELWKRIPGVAQHEVEAWVAAADTGNAFADLEALLDRQAGPSPVPAS
jgi:hypothetical protein